MRLRPFLVLATVVATLPCQDPLNTSYRFRIQGPLTPLQEHILVNDFDFLTCEAKIGLEPFDVVVDPSQLQEFYSLGLQAALIARGRPFQLVGPTEAPDPSYYTTAEMEAEIDAAVAMYPNLAAKVDLTTLPGASKTINGNSIWAIKISDNVNVDEDEPAIVMASQHHAREVNSSVITITAFKRILERYSLDPAIQAVVDNYEIYIVPMVNPDGIDYVWCCDNLWRKNRRNNGNGTFGVDNNRNYPFLWGLCGSSSSGGSETYRGPSAGSEAENQTMRALIHETRPDIYLDFHSYGRDVLFMYAPCANVTSQIDTMQRHYVDDVRAILGYSSRDPSGSGEAPEDHWASGGTLSFLIEIGTSFQPPYSTTVAEEQRVWPGIEHVLETWRPSVRGHVHSTFQNQPIQATITYTPNLFNYNETNVSRARDGRYAMWLPINGSYQVTFSAPGYQPFTTTVNSGNYNSTTTLDVELEPNGIGPATLATSGTNQIGTTTQFTYTSPGGAGDTYWIALSGGTTPGLPIGARTIPLNPDGLLNASATPGMLLNGNVGTLDASGMGTASLPIPSIPALAGLTLYAGGLTLNSQYNHLVETFSPAQPLTLQP